MEEQLNQLRRNKTQDLIHKNNVELGHQSLGKKWIYKLKRDANGNIAYFKAKQVVKTYLQQFEVDFNQTFAAVIKPIAFKVFFTITAFLDLDIDQIDIKTAFFYRLIDQLVYIEMFKDIETKAN